MCSPPLPQPFGPYALQLLTVPAFQEVAKQRGGYGEERYEKEEFQGKVSFREGAEIEFWAQCL